MNGSKGFKCSILLSFVVMIGVGNILASTDGKNGVKVSEKKVTEKKEDKNKDVKNVATNTKVTQNFMVKVLASMVATLRRPVDWGVSGGKTFVGGSKKVVGKTFGKLMDIFRWFGSKLPFGEKLFGVMKKEQQKKKPAENDTLKKEADEEKKDEAKTNLKKETEKKKDEDDSQEDEGDGEGQPA